MTFWAGLRWGLMRLVDPTEFPGPIECLGWFDIIPTVLTLSQHGLSSAFAAPCRWCGFCYFILPKCESAFYRLIPWNLGAGFQPFVSCQQLLACPFSSFSGFKVIACLLFSFLYLCIHFNSPFLSSPLFVILMKFGCRRSWIHMSVYPDSLKIPIFTLWVIKQLNRCSTHVAPC